MPNNSLWCSLTPNLWYSFENYPMFSHHTCTAEHFHGLVACMFYIYLRLKEHRRMWSIFQISIITLYENYLQESKATFLNEAHLSFSISYCGDILTRSVSFESSRRKGDNIDEKVHSFEKQNLVYAKIDVLRNNSTSHNTSWFDYIM